MQRTRSVNLPGAAQLAHRDCGVDSRFMEFLIPIVAILSVFGLPAGLIALHMRQKHAEKMRMLETQAAAGRVAELEAARADLEARMRTLETIVTAGDHDLEARLRQLTSAHASEAGPRRLPGK